MTSVKRIALACCAAGGFGSAAADGSLFCGALSRRLRRHRALTESATRRSDRPLCSRKPARC